jgi:hypothetical protein
MLKTVLVSAAILLASAIAVGEETEQEATTETDAPEQVEDTGPQTKTMSGMSILGNEEAPKSLVIIPWKSSELGDDPILSNVLDERARPVDKDVFLRELRFYEIRSGN